ncbi:hypothetical protein CDAR_482661 [Caerostris darwini]|uniref:Uncharacterized protein n=1 Tax=Caerostris darwini TaxID=1538125 RepID=A0AAV4RKU2_9ARAC|nr:hypothetical protein CDAR_482661 [Caerostris darwini]
MQNLVSHPITSRKSILGSERWETTKSGAKIKAGRWTFHSDSNGLERNGPNQPIKPGKQASRRTAYFSFYLFIALGVSNLRRETSVCILSKTVCLSHSFDSLLEGKRRILLFYPSKCLCCIGEDNLHC